MNTAEGKEGSEHIEEAFDLLKDAERDRAKARVLRAEADALDAEADEDTLKAERDLEKVKDHGFVRITVNTTDSEEHKGKITYQRVVEIAYPDFAAFPNATYSIVYERGPRANPEGTLSKGGSIELAEGMRFRVKRTGES